MVRAHDKIDWPIIASNEILFNVGENRQTVFMTDSLHCNIIIYFGKTIHW